MEIRDDRGRSLKILATNRKKEIGNKKDNVYPNSSMWEQFLDINIYA